MTIPDVILRLARRHLPVDAAATEHRPAQLEQDLPDWAGAAFAPSTSQAAQLAGPSDSAASDAVQTPTDSPVHAGAVTASTPPAFSAGPSNPARPGIPGRQPDNIQTPQHQIPQHAVSAADASRHPGTLQPTATSRAAELTIAPSDDESSSGIEPTFGRPDFAQAGFPQPRFEQSTFDQSGDFAPTFPGPPDAPPAFDHQSDDSFEPLDRSTPPAGNSRDRSPVDAVGESSRQLEQTARDLEMSLTHLFTTQIETLQRLRDRVDEHERRWVEQQSARRGTL